jgi:hypothetical protein
VSNDDFVDCEEKPHRVEERDARENIRVPEKKKMMRRRKNNTRDEED